MNPIYFIELYDYNDWNNRRVWECVMQLDDTQVQQPVDSDGWTIFQHCLHIVAVEEWWIRFLQTGELRFLDHEAFTTRTALRTQWDATEQMVRSYVATLTNQELQRRVRPAFWGEGQFSVNVEQALTQVALHSADHRAQLLTHIRTFGGPTVEQDFLQYLRQGQGAT